MAASAGPAPTIVGRRIGNEHEPIVIVDDFAPDPAALRDFAAERTFGVPVTAYPGIRAPAPPTYLDAARPILATIFGQAFGLTGAARVIDLCFAIVTTPRERLTLEQRIPHIDGAEPGRVAMVHFLSEADHGGTAFFRHRSTGFETIGPDRTAAYYATLDREVRRDGPPPADYIRGSTAQFECLCEVVAKPNRAVFYRSALLHSGVIPPDLPLSPDPRVGRLTITGFFAAR